MGRRSSRPERYHRKGRDIVGAIKSRAFLLQLAMFLTLSLVGVSPSAFAKTVDQELAQELVNPIADLVSFPIQANYDRSIGPDDDGYRVTVNVQPVVPFKLSADWLVISRTILPIIYQNDILPREGSQFGLGDTVQSLFLSPKPVPVGDGGSRAYSNGLYLGLGDTRSVRVTELMLRR
jgi:hypothetical protein